MAKRQERWRDDLAAARDADLPLAEYARRHGLKAPSCTNVGPVQTAEYEELPARVERSKVVTAFGALLPR